MRNSGEATSNPFGPDNGLVVLVVVIQLNSCLGPFVIGLRSDHISHLILRIMEKNELVKGFELFYFSIIN